MKPYFLFFSSSLSHLFPMSLRLLTSLSLWLYLTALLVVNLIPNLPNPEVKTGEGFIRLDYLIHLGMYFVAGVLLGLWNQNKRLRTSLLVLLIPGLIYAAITEVLQLWVTGRTFNPVDLVYNCLGIGIGLGISMLFIKKRR